MLIFQTKVDCQGQLTFEKNHAANGGAVTFEDQSLVSSTSTPPAPPPPFPLHNALNMIYPLPTVQSVSWDRGSIPEQHGGVKGWGYSSEQSFNFSRCGSGLQLILLPAI